MSNRIAKFYKVSFEQFLNDFFILFDTYKIDDIDSIKELRRIWDNIKLPRRSTKGSAGYDIASTISFRLNPGESIIVPTGIKCQMEEDWVLMIYPRSGLGFKYHAALANTTAVIDSDYCGSKNEGHIMIKLINGGKKILDINEGDRIVQGVFLPYGVTIDDEINELRKGGFGSTGR